MITLQKDAVDPHVDREIRAFVMKHVETYNKHDATAYAELFTEDAVLVAPEGLIFGRQAIEKKYAGDFQQWHPTNFIIEIHQMNAIGNNVWKVGEWSCILQTQDGPFPTKGYYASILVHERDAWKECMSSYNIAPPAQTK